MNRISRNLAYNFIRWGMLRFLLARMVADGVAKAKRKSQQLLIIWMLMMPEMDGIWSLWDFIRRTRGLEDTLITFLYCKERIFAMAGFDGRRADWLYNKAY